MKVIIYGLIDPNTSEIRYVGKTIKSLKKRLSQHLSDIEKNNPHKFRWIKSLVSQDQKPLIIELEICDEKNWVEREKYYIQTISNLTNITLGGENGLFFTDELIKKISDGVKNAWTNETFRKNHIDKMKLFWANEINRINHSKKIKGNKHTDETKNKISESHKELWKNEEYKNKQSLNNKTKWENDEYRNKILSFIQSDEHKKNVSERFKNKPKSEITKQRMSISNVNKQKISINGQIYESLVSASKELNIPRGAIKYRLSSNNYPDYYKVV